VQTCVAGSAKTVSFMGSAHFFALLARNKSIDDKLINSVHAHRPAEADFERDCTHLHVGNSA